jgi:hypothetical protein
LFQGYSYDLCEICTRQWWTSVCAISVYVLKVYGK